MKDGWKYAAASVVGTSHIQSATPCQDAHECAYLDASGVLVCVVSDGAGSATHSAIGSQVVCRTVLQEAAKALASTVHTRTFATACVLKLQEALDQEAEAVGARPRDFACTVLVAAISDDRFSCWQLGDGVICYRSDDTSEFAYAFWPAKGEYANITDFVTDSDAAQKFEFLHEERRIVDLALLTDGLERLVLDFSAKAVHSKFFAGLFPHLHRRPPGPLPDVSIQIDAFLSSERVNKRTDDDKTLVLASSEYDDAA